MKNKLTALFTIVAVFGLAIAAYAYTRTTTGPTSAAESCCKDSCPMAKKDSAEHGKDHAKTEDHGCCGDSCPMKKGEQGKSGEHASGETHNCCGDSCQMKKKDGETKTAAPVSASDDAKNCCDNCECCKGKTKSEETSV